MVVAAPGEPTAEAIFGIAAALLTALERDGIATPTIRFTDA
jgi:hypothetical protein